MDLREVVRKISARVCLSKCFNVMRTLMKSFCFQLLSFDWQLHLMDLTERGKNVHYIFINYFFHNVKKWPNKLFGVNTLIFLKYFWPFCNIIKKGLKRAKVLYKSTKCFRVFNCFFCNPQLNLLNAISGYYYFLLFS